MRWLLLWLACLLLSGPVQARPLVADISSHEITIHTAFEGMELMLFGARNDAGDIVVVIRGPDRDAVVRRKEQVSGIWINRTQERFERVPGFYALASSRPYEEVEKSIYFRALGIGFEEALGTPRRPVGPALALEQRTQREIFTRALLRDLRQRRLYAPLPGEVEFIGETLFKATIPFPDNMPRGKYTAEVYLFSEGELIGMQTTPILVYKSGFDAFMYEAAQQHPLAYGIVAVVLALLCGWLASFIFRRT